MNALILDNYGVVEMDAGLMNEVNGGDNPLARKVAQWAAEQVAGWAIGEMCSAAWEALKNGDHSMSPGQRSLCHAHTYTNSESKSRIL